MKTPKGATIEFFDTLESNSLGSLGVNLDQHSQYGIADRTSIADGAGDINPYLYAAKVALDEMNTGSRSFCPAGKNAEMIEMQATISFDGGEPLVAVSYDGYFMEHIVVGWRDMGKLEDLLASKLTRQAVL